jgi:ribosome-binding protein aMBF1 (putative translation factor)
VVALSFWSVRHRKDATEHGINDPDSRNRSRILRAQVGIRLAGSRRAAGLTQDQLAQRVGIKVWMVSRYERGTAAPRLLTLDEMATVLNVSVDYLLSRENS